MSDSIIADSVALTVYIGNDAKSTVCFKFLQFGVSFISFDFFLNRDCVFDFLLTYRLVVFRQKFNT